MYCISDKIVSLEKKNIQKETVWAKQMYEMKRKIPQCQTHSK